MSKEYFGMLKKELEKCYSIASNARKKGFDPSSNVEIKLTVDIASRVEGIVGPKGIEPIIRGMEKEGIDRIEMAFRIAKKIAKGEIITQSVEKNIEQAVRTAVAIITEGVLVAPTEGIAKVRILDNPDGSNYVAIYYAGPIRSAGGTASALSVVFTDVARTAAGIGDYRPTDSEIERYVEEVNLYEAREAHLQYKPKDDDIRTIVANCPVCINGNPTSEREVSVHKNLKRVETNRIRGGVPLVICEGIALKSAKLLRYTKSQKLKWNWLEKIIKIKVKEDKIEIKPGYTYLEGLVAGRPIISYPSFKGGFRLRYGKTRTNGLMAKSIHPATMILTNRFLAIGTQMKIERPGKGCVLTTADGIEPPVVRLDNGDVLKVKTVDEANKLSPFVEKILFLGDIVSTVGDFLKSNHPLVQPGYCEEWWEREVEVKSLQLPIFKNPADGFKFSLEHNVPLHPSYLFFWDSISFEQFLKLIEYLKHSIIKKRNPTDKILSELKLPLNENKEILEEILVEHRVKDDYIYIDGDSAYSLLKTLGLFDDDLDKLDFERILKIIEREKEEENFDKNEDKINILNILSILSGIKINAKGGTYIGSRMGRPEKAKERIMPGKPQVLFPTGSPKNRDLLKLYKNTDETNEGKLVSLTLARFKCKSCSNISMYRKCPICGGEGELQNICSKCGAIVSGKEHCNLPVKHYDRKTINISQLFNKCRKINGGILPSSIRGVKGLMNTNKIPERLEKGLFRAKHGVYVFRDGTSRFDATDVPLTHFKPNEIEITIQQAKKLGYTKDYLGNDLTDGEQIVPLNVQDIILSEFGINYFINVTKFIDDLLVNLYGLPAFYNIEKKEGLLGQLMVGLSPHTSAGVLCRIVGFTKASVGYAHPFFHTAKRRNCDADEDGIILLMDALINFSKHYLNEGRGGTMDTPIVLNMKLNPKEVDDEAFSIEMVSKYPLEFYEACKKNLAPYKVKIKKVEDVLDSEEQYGSIPFTLNCNDINEGNLRTNYVNLKSMSEKIQLEFKLEDKIKCVDARDASRRLILNHFIPDLYGNLRSYSRQKFRCVSCNTIYRRTPLSGKCNKCGGKLILTINEGGIKKYLELSLNMCKKYSLPKYLTQRIELVKKEIENIFKDEKIKQTGLSDFV